VAIHGRWQSHRPVPDQPVPLCLLEWSVCVVDEDLVGWCGCALARWAGGPSTWSELSLPSQCPDNPVGPMLHQASGGGIGENYGPAVEVRRVCRSSSRYPGD